mmetsp:Transcript_28725/g.73702  ORF Transcript_28725/g.73702 Transcript_28725/m.73702 type:complete len:203 (+) Transcript_28725:798-1406(+)
MERATKWRAMEKGIDPANENSEKYCVMGAMMVKSVVTVIVQKATRIVPMKSTVYCFQQGIFSWSLASARIFLRQRRHASFRACAPVSAPSPSSDKMFSLLPASLASDPGRRDTFWRLEGSSAPACGGGEAGGESPSRLGNRRTCTRRVLAIASRPSPHKLPSSRAGGDGGGDSWAAALGAPDGAAAVKLTWGSSDLLPSSDI